MARYTTIQVDPAYILDSEDISVRRASPTSDNLGPIVLELGKDVRVYLKVEDAERVANLIEGMIVQIVDEEVREVFPNDDTLTPNWENEDDNA